MDSRNRDDVNKPQSTNAGDRNTSTKTDKNLGNDLGNTRDVSSRNLNSDSSYELDQKQSNGDLKDTTRRSSGTVGSSGMKSRSSGMDSDRDDLGTTSVNTSVNSDKTQDFKKGTAGFKDPSASEH